jgi:hypothetical protein
VCERVNVWVSYESLGDCVGEQASGCICERVGNWQSGRILIWIDEGMVGKENRNTKHGLQKHGTASIASKENSYVTSLVIETKCFIQCGLPSS